MKLPLPLTPAEWSQKNRGNASPDATPMPPIVSPCTQARENEGRGGERGQSRRPSSLRRARAGASVGRVADNAGRPRIGASPRSQATVPGGPRPDQHTPTSEGPRSRAQQTYSADSSGAWWAEACIASSSMVRSAVSAAPIRWKISSACRRRTSARAAWPAAMAQRPSPASA